MKKTFVWILFILAAGLRLAGLGAAQLWYDEAFSANLARLPLVNMIQATAGDTHPPLYYLLLWIIYHLGGASEFIFRLPSVLFSLASIYLLWQLARRLGYSWPIQAGALVLMAFSPMEIHFSQEARMYALFQAEILAMLLAVLGRRWAWAGLASLLALYTHNYAIFYVPVIWALAVGREMTKTAFHVAEDPAQRLPGIEKSNFRGLFLAAGLPLLLFLPWQLVIINQMGQVASGYWIQGVTEGGLVYVLYMIFWAFSMPDLWQPLAVLITIGLLVYTLWRRPNRALVWVAIMPLLLVMAASLAWRPILLFRGLVPSAPLLYLMASAAILRDGYNWRAAYAGALLVPVIVAGLWGYYVYNGANKGDIAGIINQIRAQWQPGDMVYHVNDGSLIGWAWYAPDLPQAEMVECGHNPGGLSQATRAAMGIVMVAPEEIKARPGRAWIVNSAGPMSTQCELDTAAEFIQTRPAVLVRDDKFILAGVWAYGR